MKCERRDAGVLRCSVCHDDLVAASAWECRFCHTRTHRECHFEVGRCPTYGCRGRATSERTLNGFVAAVLLIGLGGGIFFSTIGTLVRESYPARHVERSRALTPRPEPLGTTERAPLTRTAHVATDRDEAFRDLESAGETVRSEPGNVRALIERGRAKVALGDLRSGIDDLTSALTSGPDFDAYLNRGLAYGRLEDYDRALQDLSAAIAIDGKSPRSWHAYANRSLFEGMVGEVGRAFDDANRALSVDSSYVDALVYRGYARERLGDASGAAEDYAAALPKLERGSPLASWARSALGRLRR